MQSSSNVSYKKRELTLEIEAYDWYLHVDNVVLCRLAPLMTNTRCGHGHIPMYFSRKNEK